MHDIASMATRLLAYAPSTTKTASASAAPTAREGEHEYSKLFRKIAHLVRTEGLTVSEIPLDDVLSGVAAVKIASDEAPRAGSAISRSPIAAEARAFAAQLRKLAADSRREGVARVELEIERGVVEAHEKRADDPSQSGVPAVATLPLGIGPFGAIATAPSGRGLEAGLRSWAGGALGTPVGGALGGLAGAGLGAGLGYLAGGDDPAEAAALAALLGTGGAAAGAGIGGLAGSMYGSRKALEPIFAPRAPMPVRLASDYDNGHAPVGSGANPRATVGTAPLVLGAGAVGLASAAGVMPDPLGDALAAQNGAHNWFSHLTRNPGGVRTITDGVVTNIDAAQPGSLGAGPSTRPLQHLFSAKDGLKPSISELLPDKLEQAVIHMNDRAAETLADGAASLRHFFGMD